MHILIVGPRQVGKSTLINKIISSVNRPVWGFVTKKETHLLDPEHGHPIHIYDADGPHIQTKDNLVGYCWNQRPEVFTEVFDHFGERLLEKPPKDSLILMDEIGFMESKAEVFCKAILKLLDSDIPVIAAVKDKNTPFLDQVKSHPNCRVFYIREDNRDELFKDVLAFLQKQL